MIREQREVRRDEIEATLAKYGVERDVGRDTDSQRTPTERNRLVTVLSTDLTEYAEFIAEGDAEAVRDTLGRLWERLERVIVDRGGWVQDRGYDTALALWGVESAREDDAERAIRAALEMQAALRGSLDEGDDGDPLPMQVGITTGLALLTPDAETPDRVTASGPTISLAHRLERAAAPGSILISHDTYRHVRGVFDVEAGDPLRVRGRRQSLETYVVRSVKPRVLRLNTPGVEGVETRMVGRRAELERLQEAFYAAVEDGETQVVTVVGEPGLGKSRLLYEFRNWLELEGIEVWMARGRAVPEIAQRPYALLRDLFSDRFGIQDSDSPAAVRGKLEKGIAQRMDATGVDDQIRMAHLIGHLVGFDLREVDSPHLAGALVDVQGFHQEAQHHLIRFLLHIAQRTPVVIELADIHWADESSLDTINHLVRRNPELPLLVVCLARPELYERRPAWGGGQPFHTRIDLRPLSRRESRRLVAEILQRADEVPDTLRDLVVERAEGNPFYVEELIKVLIEDRVIVKEEPAWRVEMERLSNVRVPSTLTGLIQARLDGLFPTERAVLQRAAVVGRVFWDGAVRALGAADALAVEVEGVLSALVERDHVHLRAESAFAGAGEFIFASNVLRDVVLEEILGRQRRAYHACVAEWLIEHSGERVEEYAGLIADHLEQAGETERAVAYLRRAGERAAGHYANAEALGYLNRALDLTPKGDTAEQAAERYALLLAREGVYNVQAARGAQGRDLKALRQAAEILAQRHGGQEGTRRLAEAALREAIYNHRMRAYGASSAAAERAIRLAQAAQDPGIEGAAYPEWAIGTAEDLETQEARLKRALTLARAARHRVVEADSLRELGMNATGARSDFAAATAYFQEALRIYRDLGDRMGEGRTLNTLGIVCGEQGDYAAHMVYHEQGLRLCRETGNRWEEAWATVALGQSSHWQGDYASAKARVERALRIWREIGDRSTEAVALLSLGVILDALGDYARAGDCYERSYSADSDRRETQGWWQVSQSLLCHHLGDDEAAHRYAQRAVDCGERTGNPVDQTQALTVLGHAMMGLGDRVVAADAYRQALALRCKLSQLHLTPEPLAGLACVALAQEEPVQALAHVHQILDCLENRPGFEGTMEPLRIYLTCYQVLRANQDPRARPILENAYCLLQERAARIDDKDLRRSFLENVAAHREIAEEWRRDL